MARSPGTYILPIIHPAAFFRSQVNAFTAVEDWRKAVRIQKEGPSVIHPPFEDYQWRPSLADVDTYFSAMLHTDPGPWSIDFEATVDRQIVCLGIWSTRSPTTHKGLCIPFLSQGGVRYWPSDVEQVVFGICAQFFTNPLYLKIGQNTVGYDTGYPPFNQRSLIKQAWGIDVQGILGDTMAAHHTCFSELRHSLSFLSSVATDLSPYKTELWEDDNADEEEDDADDWTRILDRPDEKVRKYNLKDAFAQAIVWNGLEYEMGFGYRRTEA